MDLIPQRLDSCDMQRVTDCERAQSSHLLAKQVFKVPPRGKESFAPKAPRQSGWSLRQARRPPRLERASLLVRLSPVDAAMSAVSCSPSARLLAGLNKQKKSPAAPCLFKLFASLGFASCFVFCFALLRFASLFVLLCFASLRVLLLPSIRSGAPDRASISTLS